MKMKLRPTPNASSVKKDMGCTTINALLVPKTVTPAQKRVRAALFAKEVLDYPKIKIPARKFPLSIVSQSLKMENVNTVRVTFIWKTMSVFLAVVRSTNVTYVGAKTQNQIVFNARQDLARRKTSALLALRTVFLVILRVVNCAEMDISLRKTRKNV